MRVYKGNYICGSYHAKKYGMKEGWWYTWDGNLLRPATEVEKKAGAGAY